MRITKFRTELNKDGLNVLVKESSTNYITNQLQSPKELFDMINDLYGLNRAAEEFLYLFAFNMKNKLIGTFEVAHGTVNSTLVGMREIFIRLLLAGASCFVVVHNHPSGDPCPSNEDRSLTTRIMESAKIVGIQFLDHVIIGSYSYYSFKENDLI